MTNAEAKAIIEANAVPVFPLQIAYQDWLTAMHMAIEALDLQIPKKPMVDTVDGIHVIPVCPSCVMVLEGNERRCECGKRIDWSVYHLRL